MDGSKITILKFGRSVLQTEGDLPALVREIRRWLHVGGGVVAVISAIGSTTDALFSQAARYGGAPSQEAMASLVATGETRSAALLSLALNGDGISTTILDPTRIDLQAEGPLLDSTLLHVNADSIRLALDEFAVAVAPGFVARSGNGYTVLLGRGGSDLTALFLADRLQACCCRLIKDVDGLYETDPNSANGSRPRRFRNMHWEDALRVDGRVVQHKAIQFAALRGMAFEVTALAHDDATTVGSNQSTFFSERSAQ
jgi:homoserine dehydrogenase